MKEYWFGFISPFLPTIAHYSSSFRRMDSTPKCKQKQHATDKKTEAFISNTVGRTSMAISLQEFCPLLCYLHLY